MRTSTYRPIARADAIVTELEGEALVYDFATHRAHCMSLTAYQVYQRCDGKRTVRAIATEISTALDPKVDEAMVEAALAGLSAAGLLATPRRRLRVDLARRRMMKKMALTAGLAVAAPMVWSIVAPSVAEAASQNGITCLPQGGCPPGNSGQCCGVSMGTAMSCTDMGCTGGQTSLCSGTCQ